jgi:acyl-CoA synthetase (AMP-forming)/AMP-acid ligase II
MPGRVSGRTWTEMFADHASGEGLAVVTHDGDWRFADLTARASGWAEWLDRIDAPSGQVLPVMVGSSPTAYALLVAGAYTDRPIAPLGNRLTVPEIAACVSELGSRLLVVEPEFEALAEDVADRVGARVVALPAEPPDSCVALPEPVSRDRVIYVLHTSGTSGRPKPVRFTNDRLGSRSRVYSDLLGLRPGDVYSSSQQFHHLGGAGLLAVALSVGVSVVPPASRFTIAGWQDLASLRTTHATLAPTMIERLLADGALGFPSLRMIIYGSSPIRPVTAARLLAEHPELGVFQGYSQTEGGPITSLSPDDHRRAVEGDGERLASVGRAVPGLELAIDGADAFGVGEVIARADHLAAPGADGWLHTGDLGRVDEDGYLYLVGRKGDMIIRGGENVYPDEVERRLESHPSVREVAVVGLPHDEYGEEVVAFVVPEDPSRPIDTDGLRQYARQTLAGFKVPTDWRTVPELPRGGLGKVLRRTLRNL